MTCEVCGNTKSPAAIVARHADSLVRQHPRHALFFAHLSLEKILKALVTRATANVPPRSHDLLRLAELAGLALTAQQRGFLARFQQHCLAGRYPDLQHDRPPPAEVAAELNAAREVREWLQRQLT